MYFFVSIPYIILNLLSLTTINAQILLDMIIKFFVKGNYFHLWYFPAVIWGMLIVWLVFNKFKMEKIWVIFIGILYVIACLGDVYWGRIKHIDILCKFLTSNDYVNYIRVYIYSLTYLTLGMIISKVLKENRNIIKKVNLYYVLMTGGMVLLEEWLTWYLDWNNKFTFSLLYCPFMFVLILYLWNDPIKKYINRDIKYNFNKAASIVFFFHPIILIILSKFSLGSITTTLVTWIVFIGVTVLVDRIKIYNREK